MKKSGVDLKVGKIKIDYNKPLLWTILGLIVLLAIIIYFIVKSVNVNTVDVPKEISCVQDSDCTKSDCCHAKSCININYAPSCNGAICSMECSSILDCGQGKCACIAGKCAAIPVDAMK